MTVAARIVLEDCHVALALFEAGVQGSRWRIVYMANVALLRAVFHVLKNRDVPTSSNLKRAFDLWSAELSGSKPRPHIYWDFIFNERNLMLKEYASAAGQGVTVPGALIEFDMTTGLQRSSSLGVVQHFYTMDRGHFTGRDQRELIQEAIAWWGRQLDDLDDLARRQT